MLSMLFLLYAAATLSAFLWGLREYRRNPSPPLLMLLIPLAFLWYDSAVIALGSTIGEGPLLTALSWWRYTWHYLTLPLWIIAGAGIARLAGLEWAKPRALMGGFCLLAVAMIVIELPQVPFVDYKAACFADTVRLVPTVGPAQACNPAEASTAPSDLPIAPITTVVVMLVIGAAVWGRTRWPWMFLGALAMFVAAGIPASRFGPAYSSFGEILITWSLLLTVRKFSGKPRPAGASLAATS